MQNDPPGANLLRLAEGLAALTLAVALVLLLLGNPDV